MTDIPQWIWPLFTLLASAFGSWIGIKVSVARMEVKLERALEDIKSHTREISQHNDDLLVHDMELENALDKLSLPRVRRQPLRGWER